MTIMIVNNEYLYDLADQYALAQLGIEELPEDDMDPICAAYFRHMSYYQTAIMNRAITYLTNLNI